MANEIEKLNTIAIASIEKVNGITDTNLKYRWLVFIVRILVIGFIILTIKRYLNI